MAITYWHHSVALQVTFFDTGAATSLTESFAAVHKNVVSNTSQDEQSNSVDYSSLIWKSFGVKNKKGCK